MRHTLLFFLLVCSTLTAQKHDYVWLTGYSINDSTQWYGGSRTDFNYSPRATTFFNLPEDFNFEVPCIMSDEDGKLLFYSNGCRVMNHQHQTMENGDDLSPGPQHEFWCNTGINFSYFRTPGMLSVPYPGHPGQYLLFHSARSPSFTSPIITCHYSVIDMKANNGLGKVALKNQLLAGPDSIRRIVTAVRHGNGRDWWVVMSHFNTNLFYLFLVSPEGVKGPFLRDRRETWINGQEWGEPNVFSPDGKKFLRLTSGQPAASLLFDFDRCSGEFSNPVRFDIPEAQDNFMDTPWATFSPNSRYFYLQVNATELYQFDVQAPDINQSRMKVGVFDGHTENGLYTSFNELSTAPDGKIYMSTGDGTRFLHIIHSPDSAGLKCDFRQRDLKLPTRMSFSIPVFPNYRLYDQPNSPCDTLGINAPVAVKEPTQLLPDEGISISPNPTIGDAMLSLTDTDAALLHVRLLNVRGQVLSDIQHSKSQRTALLNLSGLPAGVFIVQVQTTKGQYIERVVKAN